MARKRQVAVFSVALAAAGLLAGCGGPKTDHLSVDDGPLPAGGNGITPVALKAKKGHKVKIAVTNTASDKEHGFSIDEFGVKQVVGPGRVTTLTFKADKTGTFKLYCQLHATHKPAELTIS
ncbi:MAG TPA: cupredoxin domain-containing protein [Acidimicrobiia bacterium]|nr:cupredoxin domain-containing protein [Acidimicrobiia bacterium]